MNYAYKFTFLFLLFFQHLFAEQETKLATLSLDASTILLENRQHEGFLAGTLIQTTCGCKPIEEIGFDDVLVDTEGNQTVLSINKIQTERYVRICIENTCICTAPKQQFYVQNNTVKSADSLQAGDYLYNNKYVSDVQIIDEPARCYNISTSQHALFIYPDVYVHNFDTIAIAASDILFFGAVEAIAPVAILIGILIPLTTFAVDYYWTRDLCTDQNYDENISDVHMALQNTEVMQQTRFYYETKRKELCDLYQNLVLLKNQLVLFSNPNHTNALNFSIGFLSAINPPAINLLQLNHICYEIQLSPTDKEKLLNLRTQELEKLEQDITDLHMSLAFHFNELLENRNFAALAAKEICDKANITTNQWNTQAYKVSSNVALAEYANQLLWQEMLNLLSSKTNEVKLIIAYYNKSPNAFFTEKTTNLQKVFTQQTTINNQLIENAERNKAIATSNISICENVLCLRLLLTPNLINKNKADAQRYRAEKEKQSLGLFQKRHDTLKNVVKKLKEEKAKKGGGGGPEKDPKDDDPLPTHNLSMIGHIFKDEEGHLIDTPENRNLLRKLVQDIKNHLGKDETFQRDWYAKPLKDDKQLWAWMRNGKIRDGGLNNKPLPWNNKTGLCSPTKPLR